MSAIRTIQDCGNNVGWPEDRMLDVAQRFAPIVYLHSKEEWFPSSVEWYLNRVALCFESDKNIILKPGVITPQTIDLLVTQEQQGISSGATAFDFDKFQWFLRIPETTGDQIRRGDPSANGVITATCYVHLRETQNPDVVDLQYWFFYPYNGDIVEGPMSSGTHDADWEHITVRLDHNAQAVQGVYYARHGDEARWAPLVQCLDPSGRPFVYSARSSHASYWTIGVQHRDSKIPLDLADDHTDSGPCWDTAQHLALLNDNPLADQANPWNRFSGHWGGSKGGGLFGSKSPESPGFKGSWCVDK